MDAHGVVLGLRQLGDLLGECEVADQFFHVVLQGVLNFAEGGGAHAHQASGEAVFADDARFFVAGHADAGDAGGDHRGHQQVDAVAVSVGLHHRADLRLGADMLLQRGDVVLESDLVDLDPGVGALGLAAGGIGGASGVDQGGCGQCMAGEQGEGNRDGEAVALEHP
ncbi:hypothetical protein D9M71_686010 [compost metagenome]